MVEVTAQRHADRPAQRYRGGRHPRSLVAGDVVDAAPPGEYATLAYGQLRDVIRKLAAGFHALGVDPGNRVGILDGRDGDPVRRRTGSFST